MNPFSKISGYDHLELGAQLLVAEALKRKIKVEILDPGDEVIRLSKGKKTEYIKGATITSKESYLSTYFLDNKLICKKILLEGGILVPAGEYYQNLSAAQKRYSFWKQKKIVIKPKDTNSGIGITILEPLVGKNDFQQALKFAFRFSKDILIEEFVEGIECRFLVINNTTVAVARRFPANITGDGKHSIRELIEIKNRDPLRSEGYQTPLNFLQLGVIEKMNLKSQRFTSRSILSKGKKVFLRQNSNLSTGGDSVDYTDQVHESYKRIAEKAAKVFERKVSGIDIIMKDYKKPLNESNYSVLEINKNPGLDIHDFPLKGKNRKVEKYVLDMLGF